MRSIVATDRISLKEFASEQKDKYINILYEVVGDRLLSESTIGVMKEIISSRNLANEDIIEFTNICDRYNGLSKYALETLIKVYHKRLFAKHNLFEELDDVLGYSENRYVMFNIFINRVLILIETERKAYAFLSNRLDEFKDLYSEGFISHIKKIMENELIPLDELILPNSDLVSADEAKAKALKKIYRFDVVPRSYVVTEKYLKGYELTEADFYFDVSEEYTRSFTKEEFMKSLGLKTLDKQ